ncbi:MAG: DUF6552 family protein [Pseudomonadota bacterium]
MSAATRDPAFALKWAASAVQIAGYGATAAGMTPLNLYLFAIGICGWFAVGLVWRDTAIVILHIAAFAALLVGLASA